MVTACPVFARLLVSCLFVFGCVIAQSETTRQRAGVDPYTNGDEAELKKAGYVSYGPFEFGTNHTTTTIEELLGAEPLIWIETAHFKIGCALPELKLRGAGASGKEWVKRTKAELDELREVMPKIKKRVKTLDPWLRAHLIALRLEKLYAEVQANLGRDDAWFEGSHNPSDAETFTGKGPYMGMRGKFTVLLLQKASSHARYTRAHQGREMEAPTRFCDFGTGSMYWGASEETAEGLFKNDMALQSHLAFNVAHNLYSGYRSFAHGLPAWVGTGLAHYHSRLVSPRYPTFDQDHGDDKRTRSAFWEWDKICVGLAKYGAFKPLSEFAMLESAGKYDIENHMQAWCTMEFLLTQHPKETARFLHLLKDPFHEHRAVPTQDELNARQQKALQDAFGQDVDAVEAAWKEHLTGKRGR